MELDLPEYSVENTLRAHMGLGPDKFSYRQAKMDGMLMMMLHLTNKGPATEPESQPEPANAS